MKPLTVILLGSAVLAAAAVFSVGWLWFMLRRPAQWAALVEKGDQFLVRIGIMSPARAEKCKRFNLATGRKLMLILAAAVLLECGGGLLFIAFRLISSGVLFHH